MTRVADQWDKVGLEDNGKNNIDETVGGVVQGLMILSDYFMGLKPKLPNPREGPTNMPSKVFQRWVQEVAAPPLNAGPLFKCVANSVDP